MHAKQHGQNNVQYGLPTGHIVHQDGRVAKMNAYTMLHIKIHYTVGKQRAENVNNNVAIWDYREATTLFHSLPLSLRVCLCPTAERTNNLICKRLHCTNCTQLLLDTDGRERKGRNERWEDKKLWFWAVFLCFTALFDSIGSAIIRRRHQYRLLGQFFFALFPAQTIHLHFCGDLLWFFYCIIVDRKYIWIPQRQKNELAQKGNNNRKPNITQQTRKDWYRTKDANVCPVHFVGSFFARCCCCFLFLILVSLASIEVNPLPNTNLWSNIKQISLLVAFVCL